jgi:hypothetical protein
VWALDYPKAYEITSKDGNAGKGIDNATLNDAAKLNNDLKTHQLKKSDWAMTKEALEVGVPEIENAAANFMNQQFANLYGMMASTMPTTESSNESLAENMIVSSQSDKT